MDLVQQHIVMVIYYNLSLQEYYEELRPSRRKNALINQKNTE